MKRILFQVFTAFVFLIYYSSCEKLKNDASSDFINKKGWKIILYQENSQNHTDKFSDYTFDFMANGELFATYKNNQIAGVWSTGIDDSKNKLIINFNNDALEDLNEDWEIIEQSPSIIKLRHISGGNGEIDNLTFEKI